MLQGNSAFNGVYRLHSEHHGWPVLKSANGMYCYRYAPEDWWSLRTDWAPSAKFDFCRAYLRSAAGPVPIGASTWKVWVGHEDSDEDEANPWGDQEVTVSLLVRVSSHSRVTLATD